MNYLEEYSIGGCHLGISKSDNKMKIWIGGCCVNSNLDTVEEARKKLAVYIDQRFTAEIVEHETRAKELQRELQELTIHPAGLLHFITKYGEPIL